VSTPLSARAMVADSPRKAVNLSVDAQLLAKAREFGINLSATLEQALIESVKQELGRRWLEENAEAINAYNQHVERHGVFSDGLRSF
jgi:antitoxin CcdA